MKLIGHDEIPEPDTAGDWLRRLGDPKTRQVGLKMVEVPVGMSERYFGESSITKIRSIYYMLKVLLAMFVDCFKKRPKCMAEGGILKKNFSGY